MVQPALSMQVNALEKEIGAKLLIRTSRKVELTEAGRRFRVEAERALQQVDLATRAARQAASGLVGTIRIGFVGNTFFAGILAANIRAFRGTHQEIDIDLREMTTAAQIDAILEQRLDIGYCPVFASGFHPGLRAHTVGDWPWITAMADDNPLAQKESLDANDLRQASFILFAADDSDNGQLALLSRLLGHEPLVAHRVSSTLSVLTLASSGLGVALVPANLVSLQIGGLAYRPLRGDFGRSGLVMLTRRADQRPTTAAYVEAVLSGATALPPAAR